MSSRSNNVMITLLYDDDSTRTYTFENVGEVNVLQLRAKIQAINENSNDEYANFYQTFISDDGEPVTRISNAKIVYVEEEVIYNG